MNLTLFQSNETIKLSAITSGGSQAVFFKINTWSEEAFLDNEEKMPFTAKILPSKASKIELYRQEVWL